MGEMIYDVLKRMLRSQSFTIDDEEKLWELARTLEDHEIVNTKRLRDDLEIAREAKFSISLIRRMRLW